MLNKHRTCLMYVCLFILRLIERSSCCYHSWPCTRNRFFSYRTSKEQFHLEINQFVFELKSQFKCHNGAERSSSPLSFPKHLKPSGPQIGYRRPFLSFLSNQRSCQHQRIFSDVKDLLNHCKNSPMFRYKECQTFII